VVSERGEALGDGVVPDRRAGGATLDAVLTDHVGYPDVRLDLHQPDCSQAEVVVGAVAVPPSVVLFRFGPSAGDCPHEALAPGSDVVAHVGDDLPTVGLRGGGIALNEPKRLHRPSLPAGYDRAQANLPDKLARRCVNRLRGSWIPSRLIRRLVHHRSHRAGQVRRRQWRAASLLARPGTGASLPTVTARPGGETRYPPTASGILLGCGTVEARRNGRRGAVAPRTRVGVGASGS
jgi:hypothetical protein